MCEQGAWEQVHSYPEVSVAQEGPGRTGSAATAVAWDADCFLLFGGLVADDSARGMEECALDTPRRVCFYYP